MSKSSLIKLVLGGAIVHGACLSGASKELCFERDSSGIWHSGCDIANVEAERAALLDSEARHETLLQANSSKLRQINDLQAMWAAITSMNQEHKDEGALARLDILDEKYSEAAEHEKDSKDKLSTLRAAIKNFESNHVITESGLEGAVLASLYPNLFDHVHGKSGLPLSAPSGVKEGLLALFILLCLGSTQFKLSSTQKDSKKTPQKRREMEIQPNTGNEKEGVQDQKSLALHFKRIVIAAKLLSQRIDVLRLKKMEMT